MIIISSCTKQEPQRTSNEVLVDGIAFSSGDYSRMVSRLTKLMVKVVKADATNERGQRNVIDGEAEFLKGFDFNKNGKLRRTIYAPYTAAIDRVTGKLTVNIPAFVPEVSIAAPVGTTHFKVISGSAEIDFENDSFVADAQESDVLPWDSTPSPVLSLENSVTAISTKPLFLALGIEFYQEVNGQQYPLKNGSYNALALVCGV